MQGWSFMASPHSGQMRTVVTFWFRCSLETLKYGLDDRVVLSLLGYRQTVWLVGLIFLGPTFRFHSGCDACMAT
jgi:hypothetical protein